MIYLYKIKGDWRGETVYLLKIGYTDDNNYKKRMETYKSSNPLGEVVSTIPGGTEEQEKRLHYKFRDHLFPDYGREWFLYDESIVEFFKSKPTLEDLDGLSEVFTKGVRDSDNFRRMVQTPCTYLIEDSSKIEKYIEKVFQEIEDNTSLEAFENYIRSDTSLKKELVDHYFLVKKRREGVLKYDVDDKAVREGLEKLLKLKQTRDKLLLLCKSFPLEISKVIVQQLGISDIIRQFFEKLGPNKIKSSSYNVTRLKKDLGIVIFNPLVLENAIYEEFKEGTRRSSSEIKEKLKAIYEEIGYKKTPKATDLLEFFEVKDVIIIRKEDKKKVRGFELVRKLK